MIKTFKRATAALVLAATTLSVATTAEARDRYYRGHGGDDAAIAIGAGIVGLAIGAMIADRGDRHYYDRAYYPKRRYVRVRGYPDYYYYYDGYPNRYYRDRYYTRYYQPYYRDRYRSSYYSKRYYDTYRRYDGRRYYDRNGYRYRDYDRRHREWHRDHGYYGNRR